MTHATALLAAGAFLTAACSAGADGEATSAAETTATAEAESDASTSEAGEDVEEDDGGDSQMNDNQDDGVSAPAAPEREPIASMGLEGQESTFRQLFNGDMRLELADFLEEMRDVDTVDRIEVDSDGAIQIALTSVWHGGERNAATAWTVARDIRTFWTQEAWEGIPFERDPEWWPSLALDVSGTTYDCDADTMLELVDRRLDRAGWEAACGAA